MASTYTSTNTYTRKNCIKNQFKIAFIRLMGYSREDYKDFIDAIEQKKIEYIKFYCYKYDEHNKEEKWLELVMFVEWDKYDRYILKGEDTVKLNLKWGETLPEVTVAIEAFEDFVKEYSLKVNFSLKFTDSVSEDERVKLRKLLGLVCGEETPWKKNAPISTIYSKSARELQELHIYIKSIDETD